MSLTGAALSEIRNILTPLGGCALGWLLVGWRSRSSCFTRPTDAVALGVVAIVWRPKR